MASSRSGDCATYANSYTSNVTDLITGKSFSGDVTISVSGSKCLFTTNAIPNHDMGEGGDFATAISTQNLSYEITTTPVQAGSPTTNIWKASVILLNGGTVDLLPAACYGEGNNALGTEKIGCGPDLIDHPWRYDAMSPLNSFGTDIHNAHVQPDGMYHYHADPNAIFEGDCNTMTAASPVIGFAADGFPVYGSCINVNGTIRSAQSSYQLKDGGGLRQSVAGYQTPTAGNGGIASSNYDGQFRGDWEYTAGLGDLDQCNGMTVDGQYGYYVTSSFPWVLACYSGTPDASFNPAPSRPPPRQIRIRVPTDIF
ncbi:MAG: YHYH protein [Candidatus Latescibacterota bacterium]|nr:YHYH protein [Candidatus Latescibacterota bacterium]